MRPGSATRCGSWRKKSCRNSASTRLAKRRSERAGAVQFDAERVEQARPARRHQPQRAAVALVSEPAALQATPADFRADMTGDVIAPLAPIEAGPAIDAPAARLLVQIGAEAFE